MGPLFAVIAALAAASQPAQAGPDRASVLRVECEDLQARVASLSESDESSQAMLTRYNARLCWVEVGLERQIAAIRTRLPDEELASAFVEEQAAWRRYRDARCDLSSREQGAALWPLVHARGCQLAESTAHRDTLRKLQNCLASAVHTDKSMPGTTCALGERDAPVDPDEFAAY